MENNVIDELKKQYGYDFVERANPWKGHDVYICGYFGVSGSLQYHMEKDGDITRISGEESLLMYKNGYDSGDIDV